MRFSTILMLIALSFSVLGRPARAQSENCSTEPSIDGSAVSINVAGTPASNDFSMTGTGCVDFLTLSPSPCASNPGFDHVVCFTPTSTCNVLFNTSTGGQGSSINVFQVDTCGEPTECSASLISDGGANPHNGVILSTSLTGGLQYCVVWERCGSANQGMTMNAQPNGSCGALPAELLSFTVAAAEAAEVSGPAGPDGEAEPDSPL